MTPALVHLMWAQLIKETKASESSGVPRIPARLTAGALGDYGV